MPPLKLSAAWKRKLGKPSEKAGRSTKGGSLRSSSGLEELALLQIHLAGLPMPEREYRFAADRKWRLDLAWKGPRVAIEIHGATWTGGRHVTGQGFENDREKMREAALLGWRVGEFTAAQVKSGQAIKWVGRALMPAGDDNE